MEYLKGKFTDYQKETKGYISGAFLPKDSLNHDDRVEINVSKLPEGFTAPKHLHQHMKTWVLVVKGKMYFKINDQPVVIAVGEFIIFEHGTPEEVEKVDPGTECITIHAPSIVGGDKEEV